MLESSSKFRRALRLFDVLFVLSVLSVIGVFFAVLSGDPSPSPKMVNEAKADGLSIETGKSAYSLGEKVEVKLSNYSDALLTEDFEPVVEVSARENLGKNYGVAMVEQRMSDFWVAVEPLWRCGGDCLKPCEQKNLIEPQITHTFFWDQQLQICQGEDQSSVKAAEPGEYRISAASMDRETGQTQVVYSNIFIIK